MMQYGWGKNGSEGELWWKFKGICHHWFSNHGVVDYGQYSCLEIGF